MKLVQEIKATPTYKQYTSSEEYSEGSQHLVELVLINPEWRTITFFAEAFKISFKHKSLNELDKQVKAVHKLLTKPCKLYLEAESKTVGNVHLNPASDADEEFQTYDYSDNRYTRTR